MRSGIVVLVTLLNASLLVPLTEGAGEKQGQGLSKPAPATETAYRVVRNLVCNPSFEMDWMHNQVTSNSRFQLLEQSDWGYAQADGLPDCWVVSPTARLDSTTSRFGKSSLQLPGTASQVLYLLGETDPRDGGAHYNAFKPLPPLLLRGVKPRPLRFGVWCKTQDATAQPSLTVAVEYGSSERLTTHKHTAAFNKGTHDWEFQEILVPVVSDLGAPHAAVVRLVYQGQGAAWFDGMLAEEEIDTAEINLLSNGSFEAFEKDWPAGWSAPALWSWSRRDYYRFTGWSHEKGQLAGGAALVPLGRNGGHSLQLTVLPGGNLAVKSQAISLNQDQPRVLEVSAWVKADNLRWLEIMAQDEKGQWLPQQDFSGCMGTDEQYRNRAVGIGSHDWQLVRKHFAPLRPVKELTLWLCARGFDGKLMQRNVVGTVWLDDLDLRERSTSRTDLEKRGVKIPGPGKPSPGKLPYHLLDLDLGERLWGRNELRLVVQNPGREAVKLEPDFPLTSPSGQTSSIKGKTVTIPPGGQVEVKVPYTLTELAPSWEHHYRLEGPCPLRFGTPSSPISLRLGGSYFYQDEKLDIGVNLNIARASLTEVATCVVAVRHPHGEKLLLRTDSVGKSLWTPDQERPKLLTGGYVDARNLISLGIDSTGLPLHPSTNPVRDCRVVATLHDREGKVIATQQSEPFGFMERPASPKLPEVIQKTEIGAGGTLLVNGKPYVFNCFPYTATDLGNIGRSLNFPSTHKMLALPFPKELVFKPAEDAGWKQKVQEFVKANKDDPKLFGYFFDHNGETSFWFKQLPEMASCQRKVAGWVREVDPNHLLLSAHWLFGHGALTPQAAQPFDFLDVIDVEPGLTWTPDCHGVRKLAGRTVSVIAGLECYYFQPVNVLRWRVYEALRQGANGIGICPSGMLKPKPEIISFLRGLYGEVEGLQGMLAGKVPTNPSKSSSAEVTLWERQDGKTRYLVAMVGEQKLEKEQTATFAVPTRAARVEVLFEGRVLTPKEGQFMDRFEGPYTVHVYRMQNE